MADITVNQTVDPGLAAPIWYPAQLLGYSNQTLTDRFDYLRQQALREPPSMDQHFMMLERYVKAGQVRSHLTQKSKQDLHLYQPGICPGLGRTISFEDPVKLFKEGHRTSRQ